MTFNISNIFGYLVINLEGEGPPKPNRDAVPLNF